jgi:phosphoserine phosphatase
LEHEEPLQAQASEGFFVLAPGPRNWLKQGKAAVLYYQCRFRRGAERTVAWIEARGAKVGAQVELETLDSDGPWTVETVLGAPLKAEALKEMQRLNRKSLSSIMNTIV